MLQLPHRYHTRHMTLTLSSDRSVSLEPRYTVIQVLRRIPGRKGRSVGDVHLLFPSLIAQEWVVAGKEAALGAWIGVGHSTGVLGWRFPGGGMDGILSVLLLILNKRAYIMGRSISPTSYSTLMH